MLLQRRRAASKLTDYARYIDIPGVPLPDVDPDDESDHEFDIVETPLAPHHILLLNALQDLVEDNLKYYIDDDGLAQPGGDLVCRRVMFMLPPGSAKSTYATVVFPTWDMGRNPHQEIILTGYGDVICKRHGRRARQICASHNYRAVFGINVDPNTRAADNWEVQNSASYKSAGILSGITGFRCDGLIWDDLTKGRKEADSAAIREDTWNAYLDDARSRKKPKAWEVGIGTRWHEDENMGRILPEGYAGESGYMQCRDGNVWYVLCLPAECERDDDPLGREIGEMLWPEWFGEDFWLDKRVNPRSWASLYQQRPSLEEGLYFKKDWFRRYNEIPENVDYYISFDPAVTEAEDADATAMHVWAVDTQAKLYLVDEWVRKCTMDVWIEQLMVWIPIYHPLAVVSEAGVIRRASEPYIQRAMMQSGQFALFEYMTRNADKSAMARSSQAMVASGQVYYPNDSIGDGMLDEHLRFPAAKDDHRVDSQANLALYLESIWASAPPGKSKPEPGTLDHEMKVKSLMPPRIKRRKSRWAK